MLRLGDLVGPRRGEGASGALVVGEPGVGKSVLLDPTARTRADVLATALGPRGARETGPEPAGRGPGDRTLLTEPQAAAPVAVIADDVHWLDQPTAAVLSYLAHRATTRAAAVRAGHPMASALDELGLPVLRLRPLCPADAADLLRELPLAPADEEPWDVVPGLMPT
ncbi:hypothetical protein ACH47Z_38010 [Streptomyces sp. NPDC020192]|uniref:hypothetical protein n=1 Tax=Streptomyces sp. NPDC020192 TaxID=3365066 RepID=UPI0037876FAB